MADDDMAGLADARPTGTRLIAGRYDVLEAMGEGFLIASFRARDRTLNRIVTIKTLLPAFLDDSEIREKLRAGLGRVLALAHPNIVRTYDVGGDGSGDSGLFIVEEYVRGIDLRERIRRAAPFQLAAATDIGIAIAEALEYAQTRGVAHGDIRPQNVLIGPDGQIKLSGFGIAEAQHLAVGDNSAALRLLLPYAAPETARTTAPTPSSDIYALGVILYELLTGDLPFPGDNPFEIALKHSQHPVPSPREVNAGVPPAIDGIVRKALAKRPEERYASATEMLTDLRVVRDALRYGKPLTWVPTARVAPPLAPTPIPDELATLPVPPARRPVAADETLLMPVPVRPASPLTPPVRVADSPYRNSAPETRPISAAVSYAPSLAPSEKKEEDAVPIGSGTRGGSRFLTSLNLFLFVLVVGGLGALVWMTLYFIKPPSDVVVPNLVGRTTTDAKALSGEEKFDLAVVDEQFRDTEPQGIIYQMQPAPGRHIREGKSVSIWVSKGPRMVDVPDVRSTTYEKARHVIEATNLRVGDYTFEYDGLEPKGNVLRQDPGAGESRPRGTRIGLVLSKGEEPPPTPTPDLPTPAPVPSTDTSASNGDTRASTGDSSGGDDTRVRTFDVKYPVPPDNAPHRIRIDVTDRDGTRTVFDESQKAGDTIKQRIEAIGKQIHIRLFDNDQLRSELTK